MNNIDRIKKNLGYIITIICLVSIIYMIGTLVWTTSYSVFVEDDFAIIPMVEGIHHDIWSYIVLAAKSSASDYMAWQGSYTGDFLYVALNPLGQAGLEQHRWTMALNSALFFLSLLVLLATTFKKIRCKSVVTSSIISATTVFALCGYETYPEVFFWFTAAVIYSIPLSIFLLAFSIYLNSDPGDERIFPIIIASALGIISMGGTLLICGAGCYAAMLILFYQFLSKREISKGKIVIFLSFLFGALLNTLAPGNYKRHSTIDNTGLDIIGAISNAFSLTLNRWHVLIGYNFLLLILIIFLCGFGFNKHRLIKTNLSFFPILALFTPVVASFPYALGTNSSIPANRCAFIIDLCIILSSFFFFFCLGNIVASSINHKFNKYFFVIVITCMLFYCKVDNYGLSNFKSYELTILHIDGVFKNHYNAHVQFYNWLRSQEGEDVIVTPEHCPYGIDNVQNLILRPEPSHWVNKYISKYCGINSITTDYD